MRQEKVTVGEIEYTLQHPGARWYIRLQDRCINKNGILNQENYIGELFSNVVVNPKVKFDDFDDDVEGMLELVEKIEFFLKTKKQKSNKGSEE